MLLIHDNVLDEALLGAESEYSDTFPVENVIDRKSSKRYRSYRAPNLMLYGNCDSDNYPTLDGQGIAVTNGTWTRDEDIKYSGVSSYCLEKTTASGGGGAYVRLQDSNSSTDLHGLTAKTTYECRARIRTNASTVSRAKLIVYEYYGGTWNTIYNHYASPTAANQWDYIKFKFTITSATTGIWFRVDIDSLEDAGTKVWVDIIKFYESNDQIEFGNCEGTDSPTLDNGYAGLTNGTWTFSAAPHTGTNSWRFQKNTAAGAGSGAVQLVDVISTTDMHGLVAGKTYRFDAWSLTTEATYTRAYISIQAYYSAAWNIIKYMPLTAFNAWVNLSGTITIPSNTTGMTIIVGLTTDAALNTLIRVDDISLMPETRLTFDLYSAQAPEFAAFIGDNLSTSAIAYFQANTSASWTSPAISEAITKNTTTGLWLLELANSTAYRYWSLVIYDFEYNEDGYVEVGYAHLGDADRYNGIDVEFAERPVPKDTDQESDSGETTGTDGAFLLEWDIGIPDCYSAKKTQLDAMIRATRKHTPFIWVADENNLAKFPARYVKWTAFDFEHIGGFELYSFKGSVKETV